MGAVRSYVAYRNATGGVCGRQVVLKTGDDGAENSRYRALVADMAKSALGIAGGLAAGDGGGLDVLAAENLPVIATAFAEPAQNAPTFFDSNPPFANENVPTGKFKYLYEHGVRTASVATLAAAGSISQLNTQQHLMEAVGIRVVNRQELPLSTLSFDAAARGVANSKADYFLFLGAGNLNTSMARSLYDTGYKLKFSEFLTAYGSDFIEVAGPAAEGVTSWIAGRAPRGGGQRRGPRLRRVDGAHHAGRLARHLRGRRLGLGQGVPRQPRGPAGPHLAATRSSPSCGPPTPSTPTASSVRSSSARS